MDFENELLVTWIILEIKSKLNISNDMISVLLHRHEHN